MSLLIKDNSRVYKLKKRKLYLKELEGMDGKLFNKPEFLVRRVKRFCAWMAVTAILTVLQC